MLQTLMAETKESSLAELESVCDSAVMMTRDLLEILESLPKNDAPELKSFIAPSLPNAVVGRFTFASYHQAALYIVREFARIFRSWLDPSDLSLADRWVLTCRLFSHELPQVEQSIYACLDKEFTAISENAPAPPIDKGNDPPDPKSRLKFNGKERSVCLDGEWHHNIGDEAYRLLEACWLAYPRSAFASHLEGDIRPREVKKKLPSKLKAVFRSGRGSQGCWLRLSETDPD